MSISNEVKLALANFEFPKGFFEVDPRKTAFFEALRGAQGKTHFAKSRHVSGRAIDIRLMFGPGRPRPSTPGGSVAHTKEWKRYRRDVRRLRKFYARQWRDFCRRHVIVDEFTEMTREDWERVRVVVDRHCHAADAARYSLLHLRESQSP